VEEREPVKNPDTRKHKRTSSKRTARDRALTELVGGATITEAAIAAKLTRTTVSKFFNHDAEFIEAYTSAVNKVRRNVEHRISAGAGRAVEVLLELFDDEDSRIRLTAACKILELHRRQPGPTIIQNSKASMTVKELMESMEVKIQNGLGGGI
jgi:hypothetical protein